MDELIDGMLALKKVLRRERRQKLLVLNLSLVGAVLCAYAAWVQDRGRSLLIILAMVILLAALRFLRDILREWKPENSPILQRLHQTPKSIVWVYTVETQLMPLGINLQREQTLCLRLLQGDELQLRASPKEVAVIKNALKIQLPHASFGYSPEREQWYMANPALLYKNEGERPE